MKKVYKNKKELILDVVKKHKKVLDVGFWGQGVKSDSANWPHNILKQASDDVYGLDLDFSDSEVGDISRYFRGSAESFLLPVKFDLIFAADLIEHLSNPGLFLESCFKNLSDDGLLILTTPNCYNLFNIIEKFSKYEPTVNPDHTCYFSLKTLKVLLKKNNFGIKNNAYVYTLNSNYKESWKKKIINMIYYLLGFVTDKFMETIVVIVEKNKNYAAA